MDLDKKSNESLQVKGMNGVSGTETILVVEDEKPLLDLAQLIFQSKGYTVLAAENGSKAVEIYKHYRKKISLVFTDIGLPGIDGRELFRKLKEMDPDVKVIFTSGIPANAKVGLTKEGAKNFIQKPYKQDEALRKVREVLDSNLMHPLKSRLFGDTGRRPAQS